MALTANTKIQFMEPQADRPKYARQVLGSKHIYAGGFVGLTPSGYAKPFEPGDIFDGIADEEFNNTSTTDGAASALGDDGERGKLKCRVINGHCHFVCTVSSVAITDIGKPVYATADDTAALKGHPDGWIGTIVDKFDTNKAVVRMRALGEKPPVHGNGVIVCESDFGHSIQPVATFNATYAQSALGNGVAGPFKITSIGAGITSAAGWSSLDGEAGGAIRALLDNDNEAQNLTCETATFMDVTYGMTFEMFGRVSVLGPTATTDVDFGIITAANSAITAGIRADIDVNTAGIGVAKFHIDGDSANILFGSDDNSAVVSATDTTIDNSTSADKRFKIVVRTSGAVEVWIDGVRYLSSTAFTVGTTLTTLYAGFANIEKSTGTDVSALVIDYMRVAGAS